MERHWLVNRTLIAKLLDTGYEVSADDQAQVASLEAFMTAFPDAVTTPSSMERIFYPRNNTMASLRSPNGVLVSFATRDDGSTILSGEVKRLLQVLDGNNVTSCFYVTNKPLFSKSREILDQVRAVYRIVHFLDTELAFNVSRHRRVPRHELMTPAEASTWLSTTKLRRSQMPRVFVDDPQVKYYDGQINDLFRVYSYSPTIGIAVKVVVVARNLEVSSK